MLRSTTFWSAIVDAVGAAGVAPPSVSGPWSTAADVAPGSTPARSRAAIAASRSRRAARAGRAGRGAGRRSVMDPCCRVCRRVSTCIRASGPPYHRGVIDTVGRTYGAQSMTAPLREVLVKAPGPAFGAAFDDPAVGFVRPVDLEQARREHDGIRGGARRPRRAGPRPGGGDPRPGPRLRVRPAAHRRRRRDPAPAREAEPRGRAERSSRHGRRRTGSRRSVGSRHRARSRVATRSGCAPTCCASGGRCAPTTPVRGSSRPSSAATPACSTSRTGRAPPSSSTSCRWSRPSPTTSRSCSCRCCPPGCTPCCPTSGYAWSRCPRTSTRRSAATCSPSGRGSWSWRTGTRSPAGGLEAAGCEVHVVPLDEVGGNGSGGVTCLTRPVLRG